MALLLETTLGDLTIDLDIEGSPDLCKNVVKLAKARYYTKSLVYNVRPNRFCQLGDPTGDGSGGACIYGILKSRPHEDVKLSEHRFLRSKGRRLSAKECQEAGRVVATEINFLKDTIGSQFLITIGPGGAGNCLDCYSPTKDAPLSIGRVTEDPSDVLGQIQKAYTDKMGRPFADIRIVRALVVHDPFDDPDGFEDLLVRQGVVIEKGRVLRSPSPDERPESEIVEKRVQADRLDETGTDEEESEAQARARETASLRQQDKSRATVLEMLGDLPSAEIKAPENVLFVCKLNPVTTDEDLELIFSRFDQKAKAEIIRDPDTGDSLCYAFIEFTDKQQCVQAYFKMNNALIDDRRIKVDFSQSVAKVWDRYNQKMRPDRLNFNTMNRNSKGGRGGRDSGRETRAHHRPGRHTFSSGRGHAETDHNRNHGRQQPDHVQRQSRRDDRRHEGRHDRHRSSSRDVDEDRYGRRRYQDDDGSGYRNAHDDPPRGHHETSGSRRKSHDSDEDSYGRKRRRYDIDDNRHRQSKGRRHRNESPGGRSRDSGRHRHREDDDASRDSDYDRDRDKRSPGERSRRDRHYSERRSRHGNEDVSDYSSEAGRPRRREKKREGRDRSESISDDSSAARDYRRRHKKSHRRFPDGSDDEDERRERKSSHKKKKKKKHRREHRKEGRKRHRHRYDSD